MFLGIQEMVQRSQQRAEDRECTFQPATAGAAGEVLAASRRAGVLGETRDELVERLAGEGERKAVVLQAIDNLQMAKFPFQPAINERSRMVRALRPR